MNETLEKLKNIDISNKFISYIIERIQRDDYRGMQISQHNRYTLEEVKVMFEEIYNLFGDDFFEIPPGDYTTIDRQKLAKEKYPKFVGLVDNINKKIGRTTINSLKKNFFVDFARAGFIDRFDEGKNFCDPQKRCNVVYGKLNKPAIEIANEDNFITLHSIFSKQIDTLFGNNISDLAGVIYESDYVDDRIKFEEFQYILSDTKLSNIEKIELLDEYRSLNVSKRMKVKKLLQKYCDPNSFEQGNKTVKRDYHNWRNETEQIMCLLKNTMYFDVRNTDFGLNRGDFGFIPSNANRNRKQIIKDEYISKHLIEKIENFEFHHIVPIKYARNKKEFEMLDTWENLIYLSKEKHREVGVNKTKIEFQNPTVNFIDIVNTENKSIQAENNKDAKYNEQLSDDIENTNRNLLKEIFEYE